MRVRAHLGIALELGLHSGHLDLLAARRCHRVRQALLVAPQVLLHRLQQRPQTLSTGRRTCCALNRATPTSIPP